MYQPLPALHSPSQNRLLAAFSESELELLAAHLELVKLPLGELLYEYGGQLRYAYFPTSAIISWYFVTASGPSAETAGVGNEGMVGISLFMGGQTTPSSAMVQAAGYAYRIESALLKQAFNDSEPIRRLLLRYTQAFIAQISQTVVCNRFHSLEQQLCRCLLSCLDRIPSGEFVTTQQLIAGMLGVSREDLLEAAEYLQRCGHIRCRRTHLAVLERTGLERRSCECYAAEKSELHRLLPEPGELAVQA